MEDVDDGGVRGMTDADEWILGAAGGGCGCLLRMTDAADVAEWMHVYWGVQEEDADAVASEDERSRRLAGSSATQPLCQVRCLPASILQQRSSHIAPYLHFPVEGRILAIVYTLQIPKK